MNKMGSKLINCSSKVLKCSKSVLKGVYWHLYSTIFLLCQVGGDKAYDYFRSVLLCCCCYWKHLKLEHISMDIFYALLLLPKHHLLLLKYLNQLVVTPFTPAILIYWDPDKMGAILHTLFSNPLFCMKIVEFSLKFHWNLFQRVQLIISNHWFK